MSSCTYLENNWTEQNAETISIAKNELTHYPEIWSRDIDQIIKIKV